MKRSYVLRILLVLAVVAVYFMVNSYNCIILKFAYFDQRILPRSDSIVKYLAVLYGTNLCSSCPSGSYLENSIVEHPDIMIIVPSAFTEIDIENLRHTFGISGNIINGKEALAPILKKIAACTASKETANNFLVRINDDGKIVSATKF